MNTPLVCVIILNWNGLKDTLECIDSVKKITYWNYKIIIVDNASFNEEARTLRESCDGNIDVILNDQNYGYTGGNNLGITYSLEKYDPEYILILNNDTIVEPQLLSNMIKVAQSNSKIGIVGAKVYYHRYPDMIQAAGAKVNMCFGKSSHIGDRKIDKGQYETNQYVDYIMGCCMLIKKVVINTIGFLDEQYFCYWDETDYCFRCRKAGYGVVYTPMARIWHKSPVKKNILERSQNKNVRSAIPYYYLTRNKFLFMRKHASKFDFCIFILYFFTYNFIFVTGACLVFHRDLIRFKGFIKGVLEGIRLKPWTVYLKKNYKLIKK